MICTVVLFSPTYRWSHSSSPSTKAFFEDYFCFAHEVGLEKAANIQKENSGVQKPFGPEFIRIRVDILAVMSQVDAADH
jgi:hypothetical protein